MGINVNVSVEELRIFADYVSNFSKYIDGDCTELQSSVAALAATMDAESIASISATVNQIAKILSDQGPVLVKLEEKVRNYADFVTRLKAATNS